MLGEGVADAVVPLSLALKGEQYANKLWRYKNADGLPAALLPHGIGGCPLALSHPA